MRLTAAEAAAAALRLPHWRIDAAHLRTVRSFPTFAGAVAFTEQLAQLAERQRHHPEWAVRYRRVEVATTTHDCGGLSARDFDLAAAVDVLALQCGGSPEPVAAIGPRPWVPPGHFYSPLTDPVEIERDAARLFPAGVRDLPGIDLRLPQQLERALALARFYGEEGFAEMPSPDRRYHLQNEYFEYGDAFLFYAMLRDLRPRRVIEVGSGFSSAVMLDTDERHLGSSLDVTFIEPHPERLLSLLRPADAARARLLRCRLQDVPLAEFARLQRNDILFLDSSHVAKTGSDVLHALFVVLPTLQSGVHVHIHDIGANFEYPPHWVREGRSWNEAYFVRAFLMHNPAWEIVLHGATLAEYAPERLLPLLPKLARSVGGSLWLRKC